MREIDKIVRNRILAEFMGFDFIANHSHFLVRKSDYLEPYHHRFHDSYEWLMAVVEKGWSVQSIN